MLHPVPVILVELPAHRELSPHSLSALFVTTRELWILTSARELPIVTQHPQKNGLAAPRELRIPTALSVVGITALPRVTSLSLVTSLRRVAVSLPGPRSLRPGATLFGPTSLAIIVVMVAALLSPSSLRSLVRLNTPMVSRVLTLNDRTVVIAINKAGIYTPVIKPPTISS